MKTFTTLFFTFGLIFSLYAQPGYLDNSFGGTGIVEIQIFIFPNPASGSFEVSFASAANKIELEIYNLLGDQIYSGIYYESATIDCTYFPPGIYIVSFKSDAGVSTQKLVVE